MNLSDISKYFTEDTLKEIIQKVHGTKLTSYDLLSGFDKKGDSYLSEIFRLKVHGLDERNMKPVSVNVIVKSMIKNPNRRKLFRCNDFFQNEINFYTKIIPIYESFQNEKNVENIFKEYPKYLASHCDGENDFIALQDVNVFGYKAPERQNCVDLEHCQLIMRTLGRFHGVSLALKDQKPDLFNEILQTVKEFYYAEKYRKWYAPFLIDAMHVAIDAVTKEYPGTVYEEKTKNFLNNKLYDTLISIVTANNQYSVIGHGDCWRPNFLMKYEYEQGISSAKEKPKNVIMIDFQLVRYSSPAVDITFFLYSCTDRQMRDDNYEKILKAYYDGVCEILQILGSDPIKVFPYDALKSELKQFGKFGCGMGIESIPLTLLDDNDVQDHDVLLDSKDVVLTDVWKISPLKNKEHRRRIADCFKHAVDCGYIS